MDNYLRHFSPIIIINGQPSSWENVGEEFLVTKANVEAYISNNSTAEGGTDKNGKIVKLNSSGRIAASMLPPLAITDTFEAASEGAMLALSNAEKGDVCIRTDLNKTFILAGDSYSVITSWKELKTPSDTVLSVNGQNGTVVLSAANVGAVANNDIATSVTSASTDSKVPSAKAVYTFVNNNYSATNHTHTSAKITDSISASSGIYSSATGLVQGKAVYSYAAPKTHTHSLSSITADLVNSYSAGVQISESSTHYQMATGQAVYDRVEERTSSVIANSISTADGITEDATGLTQGKAVKALIDSLSQNSSSSSNKELISIGSPTISITRAEQSFLYSIANGTDIALSTIGLDVKPDEIIDITIYLWGASEPIEITSLSEVIWENDTHPSFGVGGICEINLKRVAGFWFGQFHTYNLPSSGIIWVTTLSDAVSHTGTSLRDAVASATSNDTILFSPDLSGSIILEQGSISPTTREGITINGGGRITIDGNNTYQCIQIGGAGGTFTLRGLTITGGKSTNGAGGVTTPYTVNIYNCRICNNTGTNGGGIYSASGTCTITDSIIENNTGTNAGGIYANGPANITNSIIRNNTATTVGGISSGSTYGGGACTITNSIIENNTATVVGGIRVWTTGNVIRNSVIKGNQATSTYVANDVIVGGVSLKAQTDLVNCVISGNIAYTACGVDVTKTANIINCTVVGNSCLQNNPYGSIINASGTQLNMYNNAVVSNSFFTVKKAKSTVLTVTHCISDYGSWADITYDSSLPLFEDDGYTPCAGSQLIDAGDSSLNTETTDLLGNPRVNGSAIDIGAIEYTP